MRTLRSAATGLLVTVIVTLAACGGDATAPTAPQLAPGRGLLSLGLPNGATADTLLVGETVQLSANFTSPGKKVRTTTWSSSNAAATVSSQGLVTGVAGGTATIVATDGRSADSARVLVLSSSTAPAPAPAPSTGGAAVFGLMGSVPSVAAVEGLGGAFARYEQDFRVVGDQRWATDGTWYDPANYYDRAMINYVWWARTGNATYLDRANALALNYRKNYLEARGFPLDPWWLMLDGIALHYLVTGDAASLTAISKMADRIAASGYVNDIGSVGATDNRDQARVLMTFVLAHHLKAPSAAGNSWAASARAALTKILATQSADGAYRMTGANQCGYNKPFMVGLLNDAMSRYHGLVEADSRIVPAIKKSLDYMWANDWLSADQAFVYLGGPCGSDGRWAAADLNNLISSGFGFVYRQTGDGTYRTRGDAVFVGGVNGGWLGSAKHFNQAYTSSYRYLAYR